MTLAEAQRMAHLGSWVWHIDTDHLEWSDEQYRLFGYEPGETEPSYEGFLAAVHPEDRGRVMEATRLALAGADAYQLEFRIYRPDGSVRFLDAQTKLFRTKGGRPERMLGTALDITERKQLEAALRAREQRYAKAVQIAQVGYWEHDFGSDAVSWSDEVYRLFGAAHHQFDRTYEAFLRFVHPDDHARVKQAARAAIATDKPLEIEYRIVRPDGNERVIRSVAEGRFDEAGKPVGRHGVVHDITERKRAEAELRHSLRYQEIIASILRLSLGPVSLDETLSQALRLVLTTEELSLENKGCIFLVEDDRQELVMRVRQGLPDAMLESCGRVPFGRCICGRAAQSQRLLHIEQVDCRHELTYPDMAPHGHYCAPISSDGKVMGVLNLYIPEGHQRLAVEERFIASIADTLALIIRRRRAEQALAKTQAQYEDLYNKAPDMYASVDARTAKIIQCNETLAAALGYPKAEIIGQTIFNMSPPNCLRDVRKAFDTFVETGEARDVELQLQRKDGSKLDVSLNMTAVRDPHGQILYSRAAWRDITERRLVEAQARAHQAQLAHVARLSTMGEMATGIAHEINQPLAAMVTFTQACLRLMQPGTADLDKVREAMREVAEQGLRAGEIIRRLREFTRLKEIKSARVDLNRLVREAVRFVEAEARDRGIAIDLQLAETLPEVRVDAIQVEQVILNLLRNGLEAIGRPNGGEAVLTVKTTAGETATVDLSVSDTGPGLPEHLVGRIFDPFFTTKTQGMGMGLSISRSIIEAHKGRLWVDNRRRDGATFHVSLPSAQREHRVEH